MELHKEVIYILTITLTDTQLNNLLQFLSRVDMKGEEAYAYVSLLEILKRPKIMEGGIEQSIEQGSGHGSGQGSRQGSRQGSKQGLEQYSKQDSKTPVEDKETANTKK